MERILGLAPPSRSSFRSLSFKGAIPYAVWGSMRSWVDVPHPRLDIKQGTNSPSTDVPTPTTVPPWTMSYHPLQPNTAFWPTSCVSLEILISDTAQDFGRFSVRNCVLEIYGSNYADAWSVTNPTWRPYLSAGVGWPQQQSPRHLYNKDALLSWGGPPHAQQACTPMRRYLALYTLMEWSSGLIKYAPSVVHLLVICIRGWCMTCSCIVGLYLSQAEVQRRHDDPWLVSWFRVIPELLWTRQCEYITPVWGCNLLCKLHAQGWCLTANFTLYVPWPCLRVSVWSQYIKNMCIHRQGPFIRICKIANSKS